MRCCVAKPLLAKQKRICGRSRLRVGVGAVRVRILRKQVKGTYYLYSQYTIGSHQWAHYRVLSGCICHSPRSGTCSCSAAHSPTALPPIWGQLRRGSRPDFPATPPPLSPHTLLPRPVPSTSSLARGLHEDPH